MPGKRQRLGEGEMLHYPKTRDEWLALRHQYVSSTEVSALFGLNPYMTAFELATIKKAAAPDEREASERMEWGIRLQNSIARGIAETYGVKARAISGYAIDGFLHCKMGASFDYEIVGAKDGAFEGDTVLRDMYAKHGAGVLEIKNVDWLQFKKWQAGDGTIEAPAHIEIQVQHQLACIARSWAAIGVLVGGNTLELLVRERDYAVCKALRAKCEKFWSDMDRGVMPPIELPADAAIIAQMYRYAEPGKVLDAQGNDEIEGICREYHEAGRAEKTASDAKSAAKAKLLLAIGDAERVLANGYSVSAGVTAEAEIPAYTRKAYRNIRVTAKREKASV
ncbi:YqaJ viral recombinase family protein [Sphingopyxis sp.]|uniref:YqaJ viral recombinase family protein n=1 Tax=Sphingopyxis sp. TaxID=1908224 RepID=UPI0025DA1DC5|nr:YqaJ viral recombinase family protein [Sphingopyxis sp.]MBK6413996.1 YqaJ viral recombinase family protein [Sphingopyxis sp.]